MTRRKLILAAGIAASGAGLPARHAAARAERDPDLFGAIYAGTTERKVSGRDLVRGLAEADVAFVGEFHDDPLTHHAELRILEELHGKVGDRLTLAMEMFERDGQGALDDYLAGRIDEAALGKRLTLWSNYATDYRPMIEFAKANGVPVVGSNAPQRIVRRVGREGLAAVRHSLTPDDLALIARTIVIPDADSGDVYAHRFGEVIGAGHGDGQGMDAAMVRRFFEAQCVRDATMAESISRALNAGRFVLHINGGFHSDAGLGAAQRLLWLRPLATRVAVVKVIPYRGNLDTKDSLGEGDYRLFVPDTRPPEKAGG